MKARICPACSCSLARLGVAPEDAAYREHHGARLAFCCEGCAAIFDEDPERYVREIEDWIVCPTCLGEKPKDMAVSIEHEGMTVYFCRCPGCVDAFRARPAELLARLEG